MILKINKEFQSLIPPLSIEEYQQLEKNIIADGCREPLVVWQGTIVDGHNRYKICTEHNIPFNIVEKQFDSEEDAIHWIILNLLGRRNTPIEIQSKGVSQDMKDTGRRTYLKISDIKIGQRVRDDYGDMESLAKSIQEHGLLHPIVVDLDYNLIAGCRRLLACERIGLKEIEAKVLENVSEKELRVLELEENIRRKDLTELEKSKNLVELAEIKERELIEKAEKEFHTESVRNVGRPKVISSLGSVADEIGVPKQSLYDAKQHVAAVDEFPPLENLPKYKAIETAKELREAPEEEREKILDFSQRKQQTLSGQKEEDFYSYMDECWKLTKKYHKAMDAFMWINADEKDFKMLGEVIQADTATSHLREVEDSISKLSRMQKFLKGVINHESNKNVREKS